MKKHPSPSMLKIRRETLASLTSNVGERLAGGVIIYSIDVCGITELCTWGSACRTGTCPSVDNECHPSADASCFC